MTVSPGVRRSLILAVLAIVVLLGVAFMFRTEAVPVDLEAIERGPLTVTVDEEGETRVKDIYVVSAPIAGRVLRLDAEVGDPVVARETVLARIQEADPAFLDIRTRQQAEAEVAAAEAALGLAEAELRRAEAERRFAEGDLARAKQLVRRETISERAMERAELDVDLAKAAVATAEATVQVRRSELATARAALIEPVADEAPSAADGCCFQVRSPVSGEVLRLLHQSEGIVAAGTGLLEVGDSRDLEVVVDLLSQDAVQVAPGAAVSIEGWGGGPLAGRVRRIEPRGFTKVSALGIEEQRVNVVIDFDDPEAAGEVLRHGYRVDLRIVVWQSEDVLKLPLGALFREGDGWAVLVAEGERATTRQVELGRQNSLHAEVKGGLEAGEEVVLHPSNRVTDGTRITPRITAAAS
jgi:HlyD family secretion protein